jgi:uncharacterized membrane protein
MVAIMPSHHCGFFMKTPSPEQAALHADTIVGTHSADRLRTIDQWRVVCLACTLGLIVLGLGWEIWWAPLKGGTGALALKVLPLTLCLTGLLKHRMGAYRALSLLVWLYVLEGLMRGVTDQGVSQVLAWLETLLGVVLFTACSVYVRLRLKVLPPKVEATP